MNLSEPEILQALRKWRTRMSAAAWVVVRDTHAAEDIFQNVALKAMTREVSFESEGALLSWAFITARREGIDWLRRHRREALGLGEEIFELLEWEWRAASPQPSGARIDALRECLAAAPQSARQLLRLRHFDGYSCEERPGIEQRLRTDPEARAFLREVAEQSVMVADLDRATLGQRAERSPRFADAARPKRLLGAARFRPWQRALAAAAVMMELTDVYALTIQNDAGLEISHIELGPAEAPR